MVRKFPCPVQSTKMIEEQNDSTDGHLLKQYLKNLINICIQIFNSSLSISIFYKYGKCSKISNTSCLPKRPRETKQTQIRLLLKKQSDQVLPCLLF